MKRRIVGTAGHIDHGKTSLVRALTGVDTDRLPEEKRRGITIDLGFAHLPMDDMQIGFVDVPGHERFVRNMLAGIGGIDAAMLVVAADESIMPQTREHFAICRLLRIPTGIVAITKVDTVEPELVEIVRLEVEELVRGSFLEGKPIVSTSASTGAGLEALRAALRDALASSPERAIEGHVFRLPIDRAFTMKGFGSVVTGTTISGSVTAESDLELFPARIRTRARNIQVHGVPRDRVVAGERTSINLADVALDSLGRGQQLATPGTLRTSQILTAEIELLPDSTPLEDQTRVRIHHFAAELLANVRIVGGTAAAIEPGGKAWVQLRLEAPVVAVSGDRFVIRRYSPATTIGGGVVLDPHLGKLTRGTRAELFATLGSGSLAARVELLARLAGPAGIPLHELQARTGRTTASLRSELDSAPPATIELGQGDAARYVHPDAVRDVRKLAMEVLELFFRENRTVVGMPKSEFLQKIRLGRLDPATVGFLMQDLQNEKIAQIEGDLIHVPGRSKALGGVEGELSREIESRFRGAGLTPPPVSELIKTIAQRPKTIEGVLGFLAKTGVLVRLADNIYVHREVIAAARERLSTHKGESVDIAWFKDFYGITRKVVIPLLEYFDRVGVTRRVGDHRQIV